MKNGNTLPKYSFLSLLLISFVLIMIPSSRFVYSTKALLSYIAYPDFNFLVKYEKLIKNVPENIKRVIEADIYNRENEEKNKHLAVQLSLMSRLKEENERFRKLLSFSSYIPNKGIFASVLSKNPHSSASGFFVDKGKSAGIKEGYPVLGFDGERLSVAGIVAETYQDFSRISVLGNPEFSFMVQMGKDSAEGLLMSKGDRDIVVNYIPSKYNVLIGEKIYTSYNSQTLPGGLLVGTVGDVYKKSSAMNFYEIKVKTEIDMDRISEVYILNYSSPILMEGI